jgi:translation initiation factor IF-2
MNNGKVRIYELSKELNLENKDLLEICEQLNIAVKSHSSTITEAQAEAIRITAPKYIASHAGGKNHSPNDPNTENPDKTKSGKQQILAIHHKQTSPNSEITEEKTKTMVASPPRPVKSELPTKQEKQTPLSTSTQTPVSQSQSNQTKPSMPEATKVESPKLLEPPARGSDEKEGKPKADKRPTLKLANKKGDTPTAKPSQPVKKPTPAPAKAEAKPSSEANKVVKPKLQKPPQRPKPPQKNQEEIIEADLIDDEDIKDEPELDTELLLEKPKKLAQKPKRPPIPVKTGKKKGWEEEEEDDEKAKAAKNAPKNKKRSQLIIDEDDEELDELGISLVGAAASSISISIARPPKPAALAGAIATPAPSVAKTKKPTPKGEGTSSSSRNDSREKRREKTVKQEKPESIVLSESLTVRDLAELLQVPETDIIKQLFFKGIAVNITQTLELETARMVVEEMGVTIETEEEVAAATKSTEMLDLADLENLQRRPPVVTIMGHVDHGKTTLLDSIRKTKVAQGEAGGITQHIGAYHVDLEHNGKPEQIVFLDTPGHEAFTAMRARGARVTDIAILVVAADDGVQPQTREAISHAKAAEVPIVIAINKVDKPGAEPDRVKQELSEFGLVPEEWGGETIMVPVSALKGEGLDTLLEMLLLVSEVEELSANPDRSAKGTVIEAHLDRARGPVATLLIQNGTLRVGDIIVAGGVFGKIRAMIDDRGDKVENATPSFAVEVLGLNEVPAAGDEFDVVDNEKTARAIAEARTENQRQSRLQQSMRDRRVTLTTLSAQAQEGQLKELNLILKADVQGSVEAILGSLKQLPQNEVQIRVLLAAPGEVTETDVDLAAASGAVVIGFNTTLASGARMAADQEGVDIREYNIIYKLLDDIQAAMEGLLDPEEVEEHLGQAEVRAVFTVGRNAVAGCYVQSGKIVRNRFIRVRRGKEVIFDGVLDSLKRMKEDAKEVNAGYECGIGTSKFNDWQEGDIIEAYQMVMKRRTLSPN